jgi:hypothetical protein
VAQGFIKYFSEEYDHYFFLADDLVLNPIINETNYHVHLKLKKETCFIPRLSTIDENKAFWALNKAAMNYTIHVPGVEVTNQLPAYNDALQLLKNFGLQNKQLVFNQIWNKDEIVKKSRISIIDSCLYVLRKAKNKITKKKYNIPYPLVRSYSDIFVVSSNSIKQFCHYCGVFATTNLFVELAIPTALVFTAKEIVTERDLLLQGRALWTKEDFLVLEKYEFILDNLMNDFPENRLYIHPVKLSKWAKIL